MILRDRQESLSLSWGQTPLRDETTNNVRRKRQGLAGSVRRQDSDSRFDHAEKGTYLSQVCRGRGGFLRLGVRKRRKTFKQFVNVREAKVGARNRLTAAASSAEHAGVCRSRFSALKY